MEVGSQGRTAPSEQTSPRPQEPAVRIPSEDVPGNEISYLPRYPGSVRVEYERAKREGLKIIRVEYLTRDELDAVRTFYRGVFRAREWQVANVEFSDNRWTFLVVHDLREANVVIETHDRDATRVDIEFSEPLPQREPAPEERPQIREDDPAPQEATPPQRATPTPTPAPQTAPAPGYDDDGGEGGDDGGGDD
jgi:hypothetical protein